MNMELRTRIFVIISVSSLIVYLCVGGLNILPSVARSDSKLDQVDQVGLPVSSPHQFDSVKTPAPSSLLPVSEISSSPEAVDATTPDPSPPFLPESEISFSPEAMTDAAATPISNHISLAPGFFDQDIALAIEARIKQSQTDSQVAMDEAKKLLEDADVASSETGKCLGKCVDRYAASLNELNRAVTDLGVRDVRLLADDFGAVEMDILTCQACFSDRFGEDSPFKALEEATAKAARECLTVMDYAV